MKTPEELAEEYRENHDECEFARDAFLAGYQAAKDEEATQDQKIAALWTALFPSKLKKDK